MTKQFTFLQLFQIIDDRITTNVDDVQIILSHVLNRSIATHEIPSAMRELRERAPMWYKVLAFEVHTLKVMHDDDIHKIIAAIEKYLNFTFDIPQL